MSRWVSVALVLGLLWSIGRQTYSHLKQLKKKRQYTGKVLKTLDSGQQKTARECWEAGNTQGEPAATPACILPRETSQTTTQGGRSSRSSRGGDGPGSLGRPSSQGRALDKREPHRRRTPQTCRAPPPPPPLISTSLWGTYTRLRKEPPKSIRGNDTQAHTTTPQEWKTPQLVGNSGKHAEGSGLTYRSWKKRPEKYQTISKELNQRTELKNIYKIQKQPAPNAWHAI